MKPVFLPLPGSEVLARRLVGHVAGHVGEIEFRHFPDGEFYVRVKARIAGRRVVLTGALDRPDPKFLPLAFLAGAARDLGAAEVGFLCPYLPYMRQDKRFRPGEAITSSSFAAAMGRLVDWMITVDPHLHRRRSLSEIYSIPTMVVHAVPRIAEWLRERIREAYFFGPDSESAQWVEAIAAKTGGGATVLEKRRLGDHGVTITRTALGRSKKQTPVIIDDVISTARTMIETVRRVRAEGGPAPWCLAVHGVFADQAYEELQAAGAATIATCNTLLHPSNAIDVSDLMAAAVERMLDRRAHARQSRPQPRPGRPDADA